MQQRESTKSQAEAAAEAAQNKAADITDQATEQIVSKTVSAVREKRNTAADYVASLGAATAAAAESLSKDGCDQTAQRLTTISNFLADTGDSIGSYDVRSVIESASDVARRNPAVTFGLAALAGYAIVKFANAEPMQARVKRELPTYD